MIGWHSGAQQILSKHGVLGSVFSAWFQMLQKAGKSGKRVLFTRNVDKKICALGLMAILALPAEALPAELQVRVGYTPYDHFVSPPKSFSTGRGKGVWQGNGTCG